jgi:predicted DNA-binding transcriptional regulator YafY
LDASDKNDERAVINYTLKCKKDAVVLVMEYLGGDITEEYENGDALISLAGLENKRLWFSLLLGFGDMVEVVEPDYLRERLKLYGEKIACLYKH